MTEALAAGPPDSNLEASESFHRGVAERLQAVDSPSGLEGLAAWLRGSTLSWRVALPTVAVLVSVLLAVLVPRRHSVVSLPTPPTIQAMSVSDSGSDLAPTLANYQMVANQSLEELSELLTQQGNKSLPPAPMYTVSSLELVDSPF
ncbi:MAG: hypothetical protein NT154_40145 [Verrucomicrobia bacterium]|nr:hypothetical protein [Verrucomicrobiota bacterium]